MSRDPGTEYSAPQQWICLNSVIDPFSSPARKRQRFSSPFDEYFEEPSQEDLAALDRFEAKLQQQRQSPSKHGNVGDKENLALISPNHDQSKDSSLPGHHIRSSQAVSDSDNLFIAQLPPFTSAQHLNAPSGFTSALHISAPRSSSDDRRSPSPGSPQERDYSSWFAPGPIPSITQFQLANLPVATSSSSPGHEPLTTGFMKASNKGWAMPSHNALLQAEEKMKKIWAEAAGDGASSSDATEDPVVAYALDIGKNSSASGRVGDSPTPAGFGKPSIGDVSSLPTLTASFEPFTTKPKPFRSPVTTTMRSPVPKPSLYAASPLNQRPQSSAQAFVSAGLHQSLLATSRSDSPISPFKTPSSAFVTPVRSQAAKRRVASDTSTRAKFVTPFKTGMKPGEPGHEKLLEFNKKDAKIKTSSMGIPSMKETTLRQLQEVNSNNHQEAQKRSVFDLSMLQLSFNALTPMSFHFSQVNLRPEHRWPGVVLYPNHTTLPI